MTASRTCGQELVRLLEGYGVDTVFGIPGTHTLELYRGLADSQIRHIQPRHEQGAGFMADGFARVTGRPGVCFLITGPGVLNAATAIAQAYSDSVPMLVISSVAATSDLGAAPGDIHELPSQDGTIQTFTAFSATAYTPAQVPELVARAFSVFDQGRPRPVHIQIPLDVIRQPAEFAAPVRRPSPRHPAPSRQSLDEALSLLTSAERPLILIGGGGASYGSSIAKLAEILGARIMTTIAGKGAVPDGHPLHLGSPLTREPARSQMAESDAILVLGSELATSDTWAGKLPISAPLIRVDIDAASLDRNYRSALAIHAGVGEMVDGCLEALNGHSPKPSDWSSSAETARLRATWIEDLQPLERKHVAVLEVIRRVLPENGFLAADMTQPAYTANFVFGCSQPNSYLYPVGFSTLGYALPAAIGASIGAPGRPGAVLIGDGGLLFTATELAAAVELSLPLPIILWNNHGYAQIRKHMRNRGIPEVGVSPSNPDFQAMGRAFGCRATRPMSGADLEGAIASAFKASTPTLIEVRDEDPWLQ